MKKSALAASAITLLASGVGLGDEASATASAIASASASASASGTPNPCLQPDGTYNCGWQSQIIEEIHYYPNHIPPNCRIRFRRCYFTHCTEKYMVSMQWF